MHPQTNRITPRIIGASVLGAFTLLASVAQSANINWGTPQQISGVTFQSFAAPGGNGSSGNFTITSGSGVFANNTGGASTGAPFSTLPAAYQTLLSSYITPLFGPATLTMSGLVVGMQYEFQFWSNLSSQQFGYQIMATAGNSVALLSNTAGADGGLGQWVTGTFTADSLTQSITFLGDGDGGFLNGFQLRQISQPTGQVPDTGSTLALLGLTLAGLVAAHRKLGTAGARS